MNDEEIVRRKYPQNVVTVRGKHQWKIVFFDASAEYRPRTLGRGASIQRAWACAVERLQKKENE